MAVSKGGQHKIRLLGEMLVVLIAFSVFTVAFGLLFYIVQAGLSAEPVMPTSRLGREYVSLATFFTAPLSLFCTVLVIDFILRARGKDIFMFGLSRPKNWIKTAGLGLGLSVILLALWIIMWYGEIVITGDEPATYFDIIRGNGLLYFFAMTAVAWASACFAEEVIFRGFFMNNFMELFGGGKVAIPIAVVLQAGLFTGLHGTDTLLGLVPVFVTGLFMGGLYFRIGRKLWPLIIAHGVVISVYFTYLFFLPAV